MDILPIVKRTAFTSAGEPAASRNARSSSRAADPLSEAMPSRACMNAWLFRTLVLRPSEAASGASVGSIRCACAAF